jgi:GNAT superfamily N-acetyltransferase
VAQEGTKAIGYLLGAKDTRTMEKIFAEKVLPHLLLKALTGGAFFKKKNIIFMLHLLMGVLRQEFREPDIFKEYPATLHVNISEGFRGQGLGSRLIAAYLDYLTGRGVSGVYLATLSPGAAEFFGKQGFTLAYQGKRSYFRYLLHQDLPIYIYAKKLQ